MIKKLQKKFIMLAMSVIAVVTCTIFGVIILDNYIIMNRQCNGILNLISENNGRIPEYKPRTDELAEFITKETQFSTRYFVIKADDSGEIIETNMDFIASVTAEDAKDVLQNVLKENKTQGYYKYYKYKITENDGNKLIVFLDCSMQINNLKSTTEKAILIIMIGLLLVFIFLFILSKKILSPIIESIEKQKQFVTNAGHELKTPIAVIMADADVLEMTSEENIEIVNSIKNQANRLNKLIKVLLNLSNIEERNISVNYTEFSITKIIENEILEFKALLQDKQIVYDNVQNVMIYGDMNSIHQLVTIFLDNAIKYTPDSGKIIIKTEKQGKNTKIIFANTCENCKYINKNKIFDRFYREDKSRSKEKEGYGIGLSIAKSIVEMHKGKIFVDIDNKKEMICFTIII